MTGTGTTTEILTKSYSSDFEYCRMLCESVDRFVPEAIGHRLVVPRADIPLFSQLAMTRRVIVAEEDLLPSWFRRVPMPSPSWRRRLRLPRRNVYVTPYSLPVRGWIAQQIMKIAAAAQSEADTVVHVDSENVFIRPLSMDSIYPAAGKTRIYRNPEPVGLETHVRWQHAAGRLLGLPDRAFYGGEYIDPFVVWKTSVVRGMIERIETVGGTNWIRTLARTQHFAEYVLYGVFAEHVLGFAEAGLEPQDGSLCHARWSDDFDGEDDLRDFIESVRPQHLICIIQSTVSGGADLRGRAFARITKIAAGQDAAETGSAATSRHTLSQKKR